jgi:hypothetical protein
MILPISAFQVSGITDMSHHYPSSDIVGTIPRAYSRYLKWDALQKERIELKEFPAFRGNIFKCTTCRWGDVISPLSLLAAHTR